MFDFAGTGPQVEGNTNAPRAVVLSAIIYCLRCMVGHDVPLNQVGHHGNLCWHSSLLSNLSHTHMHACMHACMQGCLKPVQVLIPSGSLLDPSETAAVVGGNVLTCQRIVDVVFRAFETCAASQGCMNNVTFGDANVGYYETVAGGAGAVSGCGWGY